MGREDVDAVSAPDEHYRRAREQAQELGIKASGLPIRWTDLSVAVEGTGSELAPNLLTTIGDALGPSLVRTVLGYIRPNRSGRVILHPQSGVVEQARRSGFVRAHRRRARCCSSWDGPARA